MTTMRCSSDSFSFNGDSSNHGVSKSAMHRNLEKNYKVPDFRHSYTQRPPHRLTAQFNDEANSFLTSYGVDKELGPVVWPALVSGKAPELAGFGLVDTEPKSFLWMCKFMAVIFAIDTLMDEGEYSDSPDQSCATVLGMTLSLLWYKPDDERLLEHAKQLNDRFTSDESRALVKAFHEDLVHARNKTKNLRDIMMPPSASAFREVWIEYCETVPAEFVSRQAHGLQDYLVGFVWERNNRKACYQIRSVEEYVVIRRLSACVLPIIIFSDFLIARSLKFPHVPNSLFYGPEMQSLLSAITDILAWHNDLFSFHKEVILAGDVHNLVKVVFEERSCASYTEAGEIAVQLVHDRIADMELAYKRLKAVASFEYHPAIGCYMSLCRDWVSGTHEWHLQSKRYDTAGTSV